MAGNIRDKAVAGIKATDEAVREHLTKPSVSPLESGRFSATSSRRGSRKGG
jgi:hypothetical protein